MLNINNQTKKLYAVSVFGTLSLSGAWVALLAARGFSLVQIGIAETVLHIVSLIFEIPSGVIADVFGRKKTLIVSTVMRTISNILMVASGSFGMVCLSMAFNALFYNFWSGSDDALAYDSFKSVGLESRFEKYSSNQILIYRLCQGLSTCAAGLSLFLGYRISYAVSIAFAIVQMLIVCSLQEVRLEPPRKDVNVPKEMLNCFAESLKFFVHEKKAVMLMFTNSLVGAVDILLVFFLQAKLPEAGIPQWALGPALLAMQAGGIIGARVILLLAKVRYRYIFAATVIGVLCGTVLEHTGMYVLMTLGGFIAALADDMLQVRSNVMLQEMFPSEQRATLISMESFTFSVIMIVLSPLAGMFFAWW